MTAATCGDEVGDVGPGREVKGKDERMMYDGPRTSEHLLCAFLRDLVVEECQQRITRLPGEC